GKQRSNAFGYKFPVFDHEYCFIRFKARSPVSDARLKEVMSDPLVVTHALRDLFHVRAEHLADVGDLVDEADARRQESIRRILNHLSRTKIRHDDWGAQR